MDDSSPTISSQPILPASEAVAVIPVKAPATYTPVFCFTLRNPVAGIAAPVAVEADVKEA